MDQVTAKSARDGKMEPRRRDGAKGATGATEGMMT